MKRFLLIISLAATASTMPMNPLTDVRIQRARAEVQGLQQALRDVQRVKYAHDAEKERIQSLIVHEEVIAFSPYAQPSHIREQALVEVQSLKERLCDIKRAQYADDAEEKRIRASIDNNKRFLSMCTVPHNS